MPPHNGSETAHRPTTAAMSAQSSMQRSFPDLDSLERTMRARMPSLRGRPEGHPIGRRGSCDVGTCLRSPRRRPMYFARLDSMTSATLRFWSCAVAWG